MLVIAKDPKVIFAYIKIIFCYQLSELPKNSLNNKRLENNCFPLMYYLSFFLNNNAFLHFR